MPKSKKVPARVMSKSEFVRGLPDLPAKKVVERGKEVGIALTPKLVWAIRSDDRTRRSPPVRGSKNRKSASRKSARKATSTRSAEELLRAVASELGLSRAIAILEKEHARVAAAIDLANG